MEPYLELKIKALGLTAEAHIIRRYESKLARARAYWNRPDHVKLRDKYVSLQNHRKHELRKAARSTHLARMFLKGIDYLVVENKAYEPPNWDAIYKMVTKYGILDSRDLAQQFEQWKQNYVPHAKRDLPAQPTAPSP